MNRIWRNLNATVQKGDRFVILLFFDQIFMEMKLKRVYFSKTDHNLFNRCCCQRYRLSMSTMLMIKIVHRKM